MFNRELPLPRFAKAPAGKFCICGAHIEEGSFSFHFPHCDVWFCPEHSFKSHLSWQREMGPYLSKKKVILVPSKRRKKR